MPLPSPLISRSPEIMRGAVVFTETRVPVQSLLDYLEDGSRLDDFLDDFPTVSREHAIAVLKLSRDLLSQGATLQRFLAFQEATHAAMPVIAVDLGYSVRKRSCGLAWSRAPHGVRLQFGQAISKTLEILESHNWAAVLVVEAALSVYHKDTGNPDIRGDFESGRGWYYGAGVLTLAAAERFLTCLASQCQSKAMIPLAEAFLSNKTASTSDAEDARNIRENFRTARPTALKRGVESAFSLVHGVPPVYVFSS